MTLREAIALFMAERDGIISEQTVGNYGLSQSVLLLHLGNVEVSAVQPHHLTQFRGALVRQEVRYERNPHRPTEHKALSLHTVNSYLRFARMVFRYAHEEGLIPTNPARKLKLVPIPAAPPKAISDADLLLLLKEAQANPDPLLAIRDYALIRFLAETGCRLGGVVSLTLGNLNLAENRALVHEKGRGGQSREGRGQEARVVFFSNTTRTALAKYLSKHPAIVRDGWQLKIQDPAAKVWRGGSGGLKARGVYLLLKRLAQRAGISGRFNPHSFRHRFATNYLDNGGDLASLSQIMGHSDTRITGDIYARWNVGGLQAKHQTFSTLPDENDSPPQEGLRLVKGREQGRVILIRRKRGA